jgi:hypothetical protein
MSQSGEDPFADVGSLPRRGLAFAAQYAGECSECGTFFATGDMVRADGQGSYECAEHEDEEFARRQERDDMWGYWD